MVFVVVTTTFAKLFFVKYFLSFFFLLCRLRLREAEHPAGSSDGHRITPRESNYASEWEREKEKKKERKIFKSILSRRAFIKFYSREQQQKKVLLPTSQLSH